MEHWRTTLFGLLSRICMGVILASVIQPELIDGVFGDYAKRTKAFCALAYFVFGQIKDAQTADKKAVQENSAQIQESQHDIRDLQPEPTNPKR